ncbi:MAG: hypothetical protein ABSH20_09680 [Tepidisphaeraceae bacterium]|jgi:lysylphosphatidylglycerol synthetase-like protein (DUF2156 family)
MANLWLKIKVWTKIIVFSAIALYVLLFLYRNTDNRAKVWLFFNHELEWSTLWLATTAFVAGAVTVLVTRMILSTVRQVRELRQDRQQHQLQKNVADMHAKAAMLQTKPASDSKPADTKPPET